MHRSLDMEHSLFPLMPFEFAEKSTSSVDSIVSFGKLLETTETLTHTRSFPETVLLHDCSVLQGTPSIKHVSLVKSDVSRNELSEHLSLREELDEGMVKLFGSTRTDVIHLNKS